MQVIKHENIIREYFQSWIENNNLKLSEVFDESIIYSECYGPVYEGLNEVKQWFNDWHLNGKVIKWDIKKILHDKNMSIVEWYFECDYKKEVSGFDGVSLIEFNKEDKIVSIKEFESKFEHYYPYKNK